MHPVGPAGGVEGGGIGRGQGAAVVLAGGHGPLQEVVGEGLEGRHGAVQGRLGLAHQQGQVAGLQGQADALGQGQAPPPPIPR